MPTQDERRRGVADPGRVFLRNFDEGVILTLGAELATTHPSGVTAHYTLNLPDVGAAPGSSGIQVLFGFPEDGYEKMRLPLIVVTRQDLEPAPQRWHSVGAMQARYPSSTAQPVQVQTPQGVIQGHDTMVDLPQAFPYDINYTITCLSRRRGGGNRSGESYSKLAVNEILQHLMKKFPPYGVVWLKDSLNEWRQYDAMASTVGSEDEVAGVTDRTVGFSFSLRVEGELDITDPTVSKVALTKVFGYHPLLCPSSTTPPEAPTPSRSRTGSR